MYTYTSDQHPPTYKKSGERNSTRGSSFRRGTSGGQGHGRFQKRSGSRPFSGRPSSGRSFSPRPASRRAPAGMSSYDLSRFINQAADTHVEEVSVVVAQNTFADFAIDDRLKATVLRRGYDQPTPIQDQVIPHILNGSDVIGLANTGTGKTAAFLLPLIHKVLNRKGEQVIVVAPTRELAQQIESELRTFTRGLPIFSVTCVGGANIGSQLRALRQYNHFVIGTPGRLLDLMERKALRLDETRTIVLDEADRMLDMGFIHDMRKIMAAMPRERHTLLFSATMSREIEKLVADFLRQPVRISVKTRDTSKNVQQDIVKVGGRDKIELLSELLRDKEFNKVLVFGRTKHGVDKLGHVLVRHGIRAEAIHGNKSQSQRQRALKQFKEGKAQVLVATDVAARGLDINDVTHVINFDLPNTYDDYIHRIGRTGRGDKKGKALTFVE